jgi:uroporphyrinogen-III synthase
MAVAVTHELERPDVLLDELGRLGLEALLWTAVRTCVPDDLEPLDAALQDIDRFDWVVFTSRRAVDTVHSLSSTALGKVRIAAVGPRVAAAVAAAGGTATVIGTGGAQALAAAMAPEMWSGARVLFPAGALASDELEKGLRNAGADPYRVEAYRTEPDGLAGDLCGAHLKSGRVGAVTFLSPSAVEGVVRAAETAGCGQELRRIQAVCVGATTADSAHGFGFRDVRVSPETSKESVARVLADLFGRRDLNQPPSDHTQPSH